MLYAWFTNATKMVALQRSPATIVYTTNRPIALVQATLDRTIVPGKTVAVVDVMRIDAGSTGGTYQGRNIPLMAPTLYCASDTTPAEPSYVTLDAVGNHLVTLTVTDAAGNTDTAYCTVSVTARTDSEIYVALDGDDSAGTSWGTAYRSIQYAVDQSVLGDTIYIKGGEYPLDPAIVISGHPGLTVLGGYAGSGSPGVTGSTATVIRRAAHLTSSDNRRFLVGTSSTMTWERVTFSGARYNASGGAVYLNDCDSTFIECGIVGTYSVANSTIYGSGLYAFGGRFRMLDSTVHNNIRYNAWWHEHGRGAGAAVRNADSFISNTVFSANRMQQRGGSCRGGGLYLENGTSVVAQCVFSNNWFSPQYAQENVFHGAGLYAHNVRSLTIHDSLFTGNGGSVGSSTLSWFGNAMFLSGTSQNAYVSRVRLINNRPPTGYANNSSAIHVDGSIAAFAGITVTNNAGSGMMLRNQAHVGVTNGLIVDNRGHGVVIGSGSAAATVALRNVTLADNTEWGVSNSLATVSMTSSIVWDNSAGALNNVGSVSYSCVADGHVGEGNIDSDPRFADAAARNYYLKSFAGRWNPATREWVSDPLPSSPCIRTGDPADERWRFEPEPNGRRVNMGAYGGTPFASKVVLRGMMILFR